MWDLWWTKWHWGRFSPSTSVSPAKFSILIMTRGRYNRPIGGRRASGLHTPLFELKKSTVNFITEVVPMRKYHAMDAWRYSSMYFQSRHLMKNNKLHAPTAIPPTKSPWFLLDRRLGRSQSRSRCCDEKNPYPFRGPHHSSRVIQSINWSLFLPSYPGSISIDVHIVT
jgi:hypothetical protein